MQGIRHDVCITSSASFLTPVHQWLWNRDLIRRNAFYLFIFYNAPELNCYPPEVALNQVHDHRISHDSLRKRNYSLHQLGFNLLPSETSLSVQWKDANYLLHSRWWLFFFWAVIVSYTNFWMIVGNQFVQFPASFCFSAMFHSKLNSMCLLRVCLLAKTSWPVSSCIIQLHQGDSNFCGG